MTAAARRDFLRHSLVVAGLGLMSGCGIPFLPSGQHAPLNRIGFLAGGSSISNASNVAAFSQGLVELGYVEGEHVSLEVRYAEGGRNDFPSWQPS
jgi:hypothetical protein